MGSEKAVPDRQASSRSGTAPPKNTRWKPGQSGNPAGRPSRKLAFQEAFFGAVDASKEQIIARILEILDKGDTKAMQLVLERLVPRIEKHEFDAGAAPSKLVIEFAKQRRDGEPSE